jgi:cytoskeletal protein CcmA (bactofilin family)
MYHSFIENDCLISGDQEFCGTIKGDVVIESNVVFTNFGMIFGNVNVKKDASLVNHGTIHGNVFGEGNARILGVVNGTVSSANYHIHRGSVVDGRCCEEDEIR